MHQAIEVGALGFLGSSIVRGAFFEDELPFHRELYAQTFHQLLMGFLDAEPGRSVLGNDPMLDLLIIMRAGSCDYICNALIWLIFASYRKMWHVAVLANFQRYNKHANAPLTAHTAKLASQ